MFLPPVPSMDYGFNGKNGQNNVDNDGENNQYDDSCAKLFMLLFDVVRPALRVSWICVPWSRYVVPLRRWGEPLFAASMCEK